MAKQRWWPWLELHGHFFHTYWSCFHVPVHLFRTYVYSHVTCTKWYLRVCLIRTTQRWFGPMMIRYTNDSGRFSSFFFGRVWWLGPKINASQPRRVWTSTPVGLEIKSTQDRSLMEIYPHITAADGFVPFPSQKTRSQWMETTSDQHVYM